MAYFPFMIQLEDKTCLLIGGGNVAARKAEMMLEFGAQVHLVAKQVCDKIWKIKNKNLSAGRPRRSGYCHYGDK